jgi:hypothetical protein
MREALDLGIGSEPIVLVKARSRTLAHLVGTINLWVIRRHTAGSRIRGVMDSIGAYHGVSLFTPAAMAGG